jgi:hypothetical protein
LKKWNAFEIMADILEQIETEDEIDAIFGTGNKAGEQDKRDQAKVSFKPPADAGHGRIQGKMDKRRRP